MLDRALVPGGDELIELGDQAASALAANVVDAVGQRLDHPGQHPQVGLAAQLLDGGIQAVVQGRCGAVEVAGLVSQTVAVGALEDGVVPHRLVPWEEAAEVGR